MSPAHGQAMGMAVTTFFGTVWWLAALRFSRFTPARLSMIVLGVGLLAWAIVEKWAQVDSSRKGVPDREPDWGTFSVVVNVEWIAILLAVIVLRTTKRAQFIIFTVALIVGLHFLPLAPVFSEPLFYLAAVGMTAASAAIFLPLDVDRRRALTCLGCGATLWLCAVLIAFLR